MSEQKQWQERDGGGSHRGIRKGRREGERRELRGAKECSGMTPCQVRLGNTIRFGGEA